MNVGHELAEARRRLGLSLEDISTRTKVSLERLSAIERGDLTQLPPLVYLNGFLHAYAAEVQLDGDDVTRRYLAELELEKAELHAASEVEVVRELEPGPQPAPEPSPARASSAVAPRYDPHVIRPEQSEPGDPAPDLFAVYSPASAAPRRRRYGAMLSVLALAVVVGILLSVNVDVLRRLLGGSPEKTAAVVSDATAPKASDPVAPASQRSEPLAVPADAARESEPVSAGAAGAARTDADVSRVPAERDPPVTASAIETDEATKRSPDTAVTEAPEEGPDDLTGWWTLTNRVESTSHQAFDQLNLGYRLRLEQRGNRITGRGQKWMENGRPLPASGRTPIALEGTRSGQRLELKFTERGAARASGGSFVLEIAPDGTLHGTFVSDAANAQGSSRARRASSPR